MSNMSGGGSGSSQVWREEWFFASGTWTNPGVNTTVEVDLWGGGGGGMGGPHNAGGQTNGANGVASSFGGLASAAGGSGGGSGGTTGYAAPQPANNGQYYGPAAAGTIPSAPGGIGFKGIAAGGIAGAATASGVIANQTAPLSGYSGAIAQYRGVVTGNVTITVGAGGIGGTGGQPSPLNGQPGAKGAVCVRWLE